MATAPTPPLVTVEEYVARFVDGGEKPACEYVGGELIPKPMAGKDHARARKNLIVLIDRLFGAAFEALPELTTRLTPSAFLIPDIAVEDKLHPVQGRCPGPGEPLPLCIEIKSPPDRVGKLFSKCEEYHKWGVPHCWIFDLENKLAWEYTPDDLEPRKVHDTIAAGSIELPLAEIFRGL